MEKNVNLNELLDRVCSPSPFSHHSYLVNVSVMGSAPTVVVFDSLESIDELLCNNPGLSVSIINVPHYV